MNSLKFILELPYLIALNLLNHFYNFGIYLKEIWLFYRYPLLLNADLLWMLSYMWKSPFDISSKETRKKNLPSNLTTYGETPWITLAQIIDPLPLKKDVHFYELGAGTGRNLLFFHYYYGFSVKGFELIAPFVQRFNALKSRLKIGETLIYEQGDWRDADLTEGDVFLLVGTCYSNEEICKTEEKLLEVKAGAFIITTSWPLSHEAFQRVSEDTHLFSWGKGTVYVHQKKLV